MQLPQALSDLLNSLEAGNGVATFGHDVIEAWSDGVRESLVDCGLLALTAAAQSIECRGCEERCFSEVITRQSRTGEVSAFVVCEVPDKQAEMGRVSVDPERLRQWQCTTGMLATLLTTRMGLDGKEVAYQSSAPLRLGMLKGPNGRRWVSLILSPLAISINQQSAPLGELLYVEAGAIELDMPRIQHLLAADSGAVDKAYVPNVDRREARKLKTQTMYQEWRDAHTELLVTHPGHDTAWYARKIARMDLARGRDWDTIRKHLR